MFFISLQDLFSFLRKSNFRIRQFQISWRHQISKHKTRNTFHWITWEVNTVCFWNLASLCHIIKEKISSKIRAKLCYTWQKFFVYVNTHFEKRKILLKAFVESQFGYFLLTWMFHSRRVNSKINYIHHECIVCKIMSCHLFEELLSLDKLLKIHHRNIESLAVELFKIKNTLLITIMNDIFQPRAVCQLKVSHWLY